MNPQTPPHAAELSIHQTLKRVEECVRREPTKVVVVALGTGLILNLLPSRVLARATASIATRLLPPVLLGLGVLKAFEICCEKDAAKMPQGR
ncbi:MAG: hypothetical protein WAW39_10785 [Prosthecobacter sp.]|uniref:hypothetical protein n=1 Tax=Prosthecobacter sp. TaxID=1965333 RepID=UPI003BAE8BFF